MVKQNFNKISDLVVRLNNSTSSKKLHKCIYTLDNISILKVLENEGIVTVKKIDHLLQHNPKGLKTKRALCSRADLAVFSGAKEPTGLSGYIYFHKNALHADLKKCHYAHFKVISKPSKKVYANLYTRHKNTYGNSQLENLGINHNLGLDFYILRTSKGIMTNKKAYSYNKHGIGGEVLLRVCVTRSE